MLIMAFYLAGPQMPICGRRGFIIIVAPPPPPGQGQVSKLLIAKQALGCATQNPLLRFGRLRRPWDRSSSQAAKTNSADLRRRESSINGPDWLAFEGPIAAIVARARPLLARAEPSRQASGFPLANGKLGWSTSTGAGHSRRAEPAKLTCQAASRAPSIHQPT